ncbi:MAG: hypothetical protein LPK12_05085 [Rhodobacterales bacterium]|nr:hypothetical protein [Rhodobacterales bacterium]MDX5499355.1 hypothetical protein [Rhodobacterales bacterium]
MRIDLSTRLFPVLRTLQADGGPLDITPTYDAQISAMPDLDYWEPQSLSSTAIVLAGPSGYSLTLQGSGIAPSSSLEDLAQAIENGIATGTFSALVLRQGTTELARLSLQSNAWTLTSDTLSLQVTGALPTTLQQLIGILAASDNAWSDPQGLTDVLNNYAATGLSLKNAGQELIGLSITADAVTLRLPDGVTGVLTGNFVTRLGDVLAAVTRADEAAGWDGDWASILLFDEFDVGSLTFRDNTGAILLQVTQTADPWMDDLYYLIDQQVWVQRDLMDAHMDALIDGAMTFPMATPGADWLVADLRPMLAIAGAGNDTITGGAAADVVMDGLGNDFVEARAGNDWIMLQGGNDTVWAGPGEDRIEIESGNNEVWAGLGNDTILAGTGNDTIGGSAGDDFISGHAGGVNELWGGTGNDMIVAGDNGGKAGGAGDNDTLHGGAGADSLMGGAGNDLVMGGYGADTILGGPGFDRLWGDGGADRFEFYRNNGWNRVEDFSASEGDTVALTRWLWSGTLTAEQVVDTYGRITDAGDAVLDFGAANTSVVLVGAGTLDGLADSIVIL